MNAQPTLFDYPNLGKADMTKDGKLLKVSPPEGATVWGESHVYIRQPKPNKQRQVLDMLIRDGSVTAYDIQWETNSTDARKIASRLRKDGFISRTEQVVGHSGIKHAKYIYSGKKP